MQDLIIPPLPIVVTEVIKFDATDPKHGAADLEVIVAPDKGISADLLRVSNSAFYGRGGKVKTLKDALSILGIKATKNLVIFLSTKAMSANLKSETFKKYLNQFPIYCALYAQKIATETKHANMSDECFLGALLHSIGLNIMALSKQMHFSSMIEACEKNKWDILKLEKDSYGTTHVELGKQAAEKWNLPQHYHNLMNISVRSQPTELTELIMQITFIAAVISSSLLQIPLPEKATDNAKSVCALLTSDTTLISRLMLPAEFEKIKNHPFAQMAGL